MGGDCLNVGCVPSKGVIRAARAWQDAPRGGRSASAAPAADPRGHGDFAAAMARMRRLRAGISDVDGAAAASQGLGVDVFLGDGRFIGAGRRSRWAASACASARAVIATGARAAVPPIPGLAEAGYPHQRDDLQPHRAAPSGWW